MYVWMLWINQRCFYQGNLKQQVPQDTSGHLGAAVLWGQSPGCIGTPAPQATSSPQAIVKAVSRRTSNYRASQQGSSLNLDARLNLKFFIQIIASSTG